MSRIDRRAFVVGCLAVPLGGCSKAQMAPTLASVPPGSISTSGVAGNWPYYLNCGYWEGNTVFVVTGGIKPGGGNAC